MNADPVVVRRRIDATTERFFGWPPADTILNAVMVGTIAVIVALVVVASGTQGVV